MGGYFAYTPAKLSCSLNNGRRTFNGVLVAHVFTHVRHPLEFSPGVSSRSGACEVTCAVFAKGHLMASTTKHLDRRELDELTLSTPEARAAYEAAKLARQASQKRRKLPAATKAKPKT